MKKQPKRKNKKQTWFIAVRGSYLPNSWQAWVLYIPFTAFLIVSLRSAVASQNSALGVFYSVFPQWICAAIVMTWIAKKTS